jgi:hypothetical protein
MIAELQEMMQAQFTAGTVDISRFEARIMGGCHQLCTHVHHLAGDHKEVRQGLVNLIGNVREIAVAVNTDHEALQTHQNAMGTAQATLEQVTSAIGRIEKFGETSK